jgi:hypothetical protein
VSLFPLLDGRNIERVIMNTSWQRPDPTAMSTLPWIFVRIAKFQYFGCIKYYFYAIYG